MVYNQMAMQPRTKSLLIFAAIAGAAIASHCPGAAAQPAAIRPGNELRTLQATPMDIADGKRLAEMNCASCHGANGISITQAIPHLAGQRPAYLYMELKAYQSGNRGDGVMNSAVKFLSDDALIKVAAYFAGLDPAAAPAAAAGPAKPDPVQAGKTIAAAACAGCHGNAGVTQIAGTPSLVGLDPKYLVDAMKAYKTGQRKHDTMKAMLVSVSEPAMNNIALFYALQTPTGAKTPASGDQAAGKDAAANCAGCHGNQGVSGNPATPSLAGQDAKYTAAALQAYKDGSRNDETMKGMTASLDDNAMKNLAAYYAVQEPKAPNVRKPLTTEEWTQRCDRCHGVNGNSTDPRLPMLAGQRADYLLKALQGYRARTRKSNEMAAMSDGLSEDDLDNLADHYARQKARAVLFVPLPGK
jgi:cytochrome c553